MNRPPATSRLVIVTLHQVQRRSGKSARGGDGVVCCADRSAMVGILSKGSRVCQCAPREEISEINIYSVSNVEYIAPCVPPLHPSSTERSYRLCTTPKAPRPTTSHHLQPGLLTHRSSPTPSGPAKPGEFALPSTSTIAPQTVSAMPNRSKPTLCSSAS